MKNDLIIFGTGKIADVLFYYFKEESNFNPVAFTVDQQFLNRSTFNDLPVVAFEEIEHAYTPSKTNVFVAIG